ncbi:MAG: carbamoyl phosphate synthase small subunit, partial [Planctomycetota bacterium]
MAIPTAAEHLGGPARLALEDGAVFTGQAFGAVGQGGLRTAEVVFNTAMTGYQEALTDPSYAGQILVMTAPLIGNYGVNSQDVESERVQVEGFVVRELARLASNCAAEQDLASYLATSGVLGVTGIDTRALTRRLRIEGALRGALSDDPSVSDAELVRAAKQAPAMAGRNLVPLVGAQEMQQVYEARDPQALRIWTLDCGVKRNILRML